MTLIEYIQMAKARQNLPSDLALDRALGNKGSSVFTWRNNKALPSDEAMEKLAELAGRNPEFALLELSAWRTSGKAKLCYQKIAEKLAATAAMLLVSLGISASAMAGTNGQQGNIASAYSVYYGKLDVMFYYQCLEIPWRIIDSIHKTSLQRH